MKKLVTTLVILVVLLAGLWVWALHKPAPATPQLAPETIPGTTVSYACSAGKTITATMVEGPTIEPTTPGQPPIPGGTAHVVLSDGRTFDLKQTISADGVRYSDGDPSLKTGDAGAESFVFWSKGNGALVLENNQAKSYIGCVQVAADPTGALPQTYVNESGTFSLRLPQDYTIDESYQYQALGPGKAIHGVQFTVPTTVTAGTNLGADTAVSVEHLTLSGTASCVADLFVDPASVSGNGGAQAQTITEGDTTYSYIATSDAAAGNRYEERVYALPGTSPCLAVRYFIHYGAIENYDPGAVTAFDKDALLATFDAVRKSLVVNE